MFGSAFVSLETVFRSNISDLELARGQYHILAILRKEKKTL
jgi:hypothetical protein